MSMSAALTQPFVENDTLSKPFFQKLPAKVIEMRIRSRVVPQMNRRDVGVGLLRTVNPVQFDVNDELHRKAWATFFKTGKWVMHFILEQPWDSVPQMIQDKVLAHLAADIGVIQTKRAPIKLVNDEVVPNVDAPEAPMTNASGDVLESMQTLAGDVYYHVPTESRKT